VSNAHSPVRRSPRIRFVATILATDWNSRSEIWGQILNLSKGGCYVRTSQTFPFGALLFIEIRYRGLRFLTDARVTYSVEREGMGLSFLNVPADQLTVLDDWLSSAAATGQPI